MLTLLLIKKRKLSADAKSTIYISVNVCRIFSVSVDELNTQRSLANTKNPSPPLNMKITVVPLTTTAGKPEFVANLEPRTTINDLKTLVQEKYNIPINQQLLLLPSPSSSPYHFTSPYGPLLPLEPLDTVSLFECGLSDRNSTIYLTLRLRVLVEADREFLIDLKWGCTIGNLRDQVKSLTKIPINNMNVSWGTIIKFGPYKDCTLESVCNSLWDYPTQPFLVEVVTSIVTPQKKKGTLSDLEDGHLDTDSEDEMAGKSGYITPGSVFTSEHRRKYNDIGPLRAKQVYGTFFGLKYRKIGTRPMIVDAIDLPGTPIPMPEGLSSIEFVKDSEIKFVILWLGGEGGLENLLTRFNFHQKSNTRCVVVKGERDLATYCFLRKLKADLVNVPICALTDCDPCSLKVLAFLRHPLVDFPPKLQRQLGGEWKKKATMYGAKIEIKWVGLKPSYNRFFQMEKFAMTAKNLETAKALLEEDGFAGMFPEWAEELNLMIECKEMAKLEAFSEFGEEYLTSVFLIEELGKHRCCRIKHSHARC